jgi:alpha-ribazole phosphatase
MYYLIRHTTPKVNPGVCYGQTDLPLAETFELEAAAVMAQLETTPQKIFTSPLFRCRHLAGHLWPGLPLQAVGALKELDFGDWENRPWNELRGPALDAWMNDFVEQAAPGGESFRDLHRRVTRWWEHTDTGDSAIITHAGVIRSLLCHINGTPLESSFHDYPIAYGQVYRLGQ